MDPEKESPYDAILRLQQKVDWINAKIISKQQRLGSRMIAGPLARLIADEIKALNVQRDAVIRNILQLKKINSNNI